MLQLTEGCKYGIRSGLICLEGEESFLRFWPRVGKQMILGGND